jgi:hypothetical protein
VEELHQTVMFPAIRPQYSTQQCFDLLEALPPLKRVIIERVWECALSHYRTTNRLLTLADLKSLFNRKYTNNDGPKTITSYSRARAKYPMLVPWPIRKGQRPPWEGGVRAEAAPVERKDDDAAESDESLFRKLAPGDQVAAGQLTFRDGNFYLNGKLAAMEALENGLVRWRPIVGLVAAGLATAVMVDSLDGVMGDGLRFCHMLHVLAPMLTR